MKKNKKKNENTFLKKKLKEKQKKDLKILERKKNQKIINL